MDLRRRGLDASYSYDERVTLRHRLDHFMVGTIKCNLVHQSSVNRKNIIFDTAYQYYGT